MGTPFEGKSTLVSVEPTLQTEAYASGDQMGTANRIQDALDDTKGTGALLSLVVVDKGKIGQPFDILFFNEEPTISSADNAALNISDSEMASKFLGRIQIGATDFIDNGASYDVTKTQVGFLFQSIAKSRDIWFVLQSKGAPTFLTTTPLTLKFGVIQD